MMGSKAELKKHAPFSRKRLNTGNIMLDVIIASVPLIIWSVYIYGARSLTIICISVAFSVGSEFLFSKYIYKTNTISDLSAVVTGLITAFAMPVSVPLWLPAFAAICASVVAKQVFGGIGKNIFNPAAFGICASYICFTGHMTCYVQPFEHLPALNLSINSQVLDNVRIYTALDKLKEGVVNPSVISDSFYGISEGGLGEISVLLLIISFIYLLFRRIYRLGPAFGYIMAIVVLTFFTAYSDSEPVEFMLTELFNGGVILIAVFLLNDYSSIPSTGGGKLIFGILCGALTVGIRYFGIAFYGEYFALLIMNGLTPFIEKLTVPRLFGGVVRRGPE